MRIKARDVPVSWEGKPSVVLARLKPEPPVEYNLLQLSEKCEPCSWIVRPSRLLLLMRDLHKQIPTGLLKAGLPVLHTVWEEVSSSVFPGLGAQLWIAGWHIPYKLTDQRLPRRGTEDKVRERNPQASLWGESPSLLSQGQAAAGTSCCSFRWKPVSCHPHQIPVLLRSVPDTE